jgi:hypothetical protein
MDALAVGNQVERATTRGWNEWCNLSALGVSPGRPCRRTKANNTGKNKAHKHNLGLF